MSIRQQELETLARDLVDDVLNNKDVEDSRFELKAQWPDSEKGAQRLAAHANASRGEYVIWIIGIDEKARSLTDITISEKGNWLRGIEKHFDGFAPRLLQDVNFKVLDKKLVALLFDSAKEAPFVIKNSLGGFPQFFVPWRVGTDMRAARREDLISILVPKRYLSRLLFELEFNRTISESVKHGYPFREDAFQNAIEDGSLQELPYFPRQHVINAYVSMRILSDTCRKHFEQSKIGWQEISHDFGFELQRIEEDLKHTAGLIDKAIESLKRFIRN